MEKSLEALQVSRDHADNILFLICALSEVRPILQKNGLSLPHGITAFLEDQTDADILTDFFLETGAVMCQTFVRPTRKILNNGTGIHAYSLYDKGEKVLNFLESEEFFPIVVTHGLTPDFLKSSSNMLPFKKEDIENLKDKQIIENIKCFISYA